MLGVLPAQVPPLGATWDVGIGILGWDLGMAWTRGSDLQVCLVHIPPSSDETCLVIDKVVYVF